MAGVCGMMFCAKGDLRLAVVTNCPPETGGTSAKRGGGGLKGERRDNYNQLLFSRKDRRERKVLFTFRIPRWRWSGRKLRYDKSAQRVYPPPSPFGYYPCRGRKWVMALHSCNNSLPLWEGWGGVHTPKTFTSLSVRCWAGKSSYRQGSVLA